MTNDVLSPELQLRVGDLLSRVAGLTAGVCRLHPGEAEALEDRLKLWELPQDKRQARAMLKRVFNEMLILIREFEERE